MSESPLLVSEQSDVAVYGLDGVPNAETLEALEEVERMKKDPSLGKAYTDVDAMMAELLA